MKHRVIKEVFEEAPIEVIADEFFDGDWDPTDWDYNLDCIDSYIYDELREVTDGEKDSLIEAIKQRFDKELSESKQEEINQLKDRKSILNWIKFYVNNDEAKEDGDVGFILSPEEILDLIVANGNK